MSVNWGALNQPGAFERAFDSGFQLAEHGRQRREQTEQRNALSAYAVDPNDQNFNALAQHLPEYAIQVRGQRDTAAREARLQELRGAAAGGDPQAMQQLAGADTDLWRGLSDDQRERMGQIADVASNAAQMVLNLRPEQQQGAWSQQMQILSQRYPELAEYGGQYSPEFLQSTIAEAGDFHQFNQSQQPSYMAIPEGGTLVNTRNPQAVQQFGNGQAPQEQQQSAPPVQMRITPREYQALVQRYGPEQVAQRIGQGGAIVTVQTPDEARTLPSGTRILLPDGSEGRVP